MGRDRMKILMVMDETTAFHSQPLPDRYEETQLIDIWDNQRGLQDKDHHGPLYPQFIKEFVSKEGPKKYDAVVIGLGCEDLIKPLEEAGYKGELFIMNEDEADPRKGHHNIIDFWKLNGLKNSLDGVLL